MMIDFNKEQDDAVETGQNPEVYTVEADTVADTGAEADKKEEKPSVLRELLSWVFTFIIAIGLTMLVKNFLIINANVPTGSMENTIMPGDRLIGNRLAYVNSTPERGDIVIFKNPDNEAETYVKRVIGLPGETIEIIDAQIYISNPEVASGVPILLEEPYLKEEWVIATGDYTFEVPEDCYLMLGDNRNNSKDARYWSNKYVHKDQILGEAVFTYWPFRDFGKLE